MPSLLPLLVNWRTTLAGAALVAHGVATGDTGSIVGGIIGVLANDPEWLKTALPFGKK